MQEHSQHFDADEASEVTLIAPRFDDDEAMRAHPVVPLDAVGNSRPDDMTAHTTFRRGARRAWPLSVVVVALLAVASVGGIATKVLRRSSTPQLAPAASMVVPDLPQPLAATDSRDEARVSRAPRRERAASAPRSDRDDEISLPVEVLRRGEREDSEGDGDERRGDGKRKGEHRKHDDDGNDLRKEIKRAKKDLPRLVDVLTGPK